MDPRKPRELRLSEAGRSPRNYDVQPRSQRRHIRSHLLDRRLRLGHTSGYRKGARPEAEMQRSALFSLLFLMGLARPTKTERQALFLLPTISAANT